VTAEGQRPVPGASVFIQALNLGATTRRHRQLHVQRAGVARHGTDRAAHGASGRLPPQTLPITLAPGTITQNFTLASAPAQLSAVVVTGAGTVSTRERLGNVINSVDSSVHPPLDAAAEHRLGAQRHGAQRDRADLVGRAGRVGVDPDPRRDVGDRDQPAAVRRRRAADRQHDDVDRAGAGGLRGDRGASVAQNRAADINPNDVESVEILKGAAASAIYGARAATAWCSSPPSAARPGRRATRCSRPSPPTACRGRCRCSAATARARAATPARATIPDCFAQLLTWGPRSRPAATFDHETDIFRTGTTLDNNLSVSGGTSARRFFLSAG
jgi:TonB-dependent SusC/RagA subfamily outer membrane receptor